MNVSNWGPGGWVFLHTITFNYPLKPTIEDKKRYTKFFNNIGEMLPCRYCRDSFKIYSKYLPIKNFLDDREGITYWLYQIHNLVNDKVFKNDSTTFGEIVRKYERYRAGCKKVKKKRTEVYGTCGVPKNTHLNNTEITRFVKKAENKYRENIKTCVNNLMECKKNPNKIPHKIRMEKYKNI